MNRIHLNSNQLKILAVITMIIDHIGYYFSYLLNENIYLACRILGRISMPIFVFLIIEGYFYTNNLKKYVKRLLILAITTQIIIIILNGLNLKFVPEYIVDVNNSLNILFSFVLILTFLHSIKEIFEHKKYMNLILVFAIINIYIYINIDYGFITLILSTLIYLCKEYIKDKNIYIIAISTIILLISILLGGMHIFIICSIPFILLYNGKLGKKSNVIKNIFYYIFPLQHLLIYLLAMICFAK